MEPIDLSAAPGYHLHAAITMADGGRFRRAAFVLALTLSVWGWTDSLRAEQFDPSRFVSAAGTCPSPQALWHVLLDMVPRSWPQLLEAKSRVTIVETGDQYRVSVDTDEGIVERTFTDPSHDCPQRARFAATFIVLALMPPQIETERPKATAAKAPEAPRPEPSPQVARGPSIARLELGGIVEAAPPVADAPSITHWGPDLRARLGAGPIAAVLGLGFMPKVDLSRNGVHAKNLRIPAMVGLRTRAVTAAFEIGIDLGLALALERYQGASSHAVSDGAELHAGAALGAIASTRTRIAPFIAVRTTYFPLSRELVTIPEGVFAHTPRLWIGGALGLSFEL